MSDHTKAPERKALACTIEKAGEEQDFDILFIASTNSADRADDTIDQEGWEFDNFDANPVFLWAHDYKTPPLGTITHREVLDGELRLGVSWSSVTQLAREVRELYEEGTLRAVSVGFRPLEWEKNKKTGGRDFKRQELLELSAVPVPMNQDAVALRELETPAIDAWLSKMIEARGWQVQAEEKAVFYHDQEAYVREATIRTNAGEQTTFVSFHTIEAEYDEGAEVWGCDDEGKICTVPDPRAGTRQQRKIVTFSPPVPFHSKWGSADAVIRMRGVDEDGLSDEEYLREIADGIFREVSLGGRLGELQLRKSFEDLAAFGDDLGVDLVTTGGVKKAMDAVRETLIERSESAPAEQEEQSAPRPSAPVFKGEAGDSDQKDTKTPAPEEAGADDETHTTSARRVLRVKLSA